MKATKKEATAAAQAVLAEFKEKVRGVGSGSGVSPEKLVHARKAAARAFSDALGLKAPSGIPAGTPDNMMWKTHRLKGEEIADYIVRVYGRAGWLDKGMTIQDLRSRDSSAVHRLYRWVRENNNHWPEQLKGRLPLDRSGAGKPRPC